MIISLILNLAPSHWNQSMDQNVIIQNWKLVQSKTNSKNKTLYLKIKIKTFFENFKRYTGKNDKSSMVLVSVRLPSGWSFIDETIDILKETVDLKRYEINENKIFFYFDEVIQK